MKAWHLSIILILVVIAGAVGAYYVSTQVPIMPTTYTCPVCGAEVPDLAEHLLIEHGITHMSP